MSVNLEKVERGSASGERTDIRALEPEDSTKPEKARRKGSRKSNLHRRNKHRLSGGTDDPAEGGARDSQSIEADNDDEVEDAAEENEQVGDTEAQQLSTSSKGSVSNQALPSTGDPRVDELLACALQNPDEASKALRSLGENLEHEMKLFLVDLMGRMRKWMDAVESKIEWSRRDLLKLHQELTLRIGQCEEGKKAMDELKEKLTSSEAARIDAQKSLTESAQNAQKEQQPVKRTTSAARSAQSCGDDVPLSRCASRILQDRTGHYDVNEMREEAERLQGCCAEMEQELLEMKKEKERMVKERAEYENAIQRALLKGVSSLNVEALKVLKCTPIPECCAPCPPSSSIEPAQNSRGDRTAPNCNNGGGNNGRYSANNNNNSCRPGNRSSHETLAAKRACPGSGGASKSKKSRDNNMLLLLHQRDAENFGIQTNCDSGGKKEKTKWLSR